MGMFSSCLAYLSRLFTTVTHPFPVTTAVLGAIGVWTLMTLELVALGRIPYLLSGGMHWTGPTVGQFVLEHRGMLHSCPA